MPPVGLEPTISAGERPQDAHLLITRPEESYRLWCVVVCDLENLKNEEAMIALGRSATAKKNLTVGVLKICYFNYDVNIDLNN